MTKSDIGESPIFQEQLPETGIDARNTKIHFKNPNVVVEKLSIPFDISEISSIVPNCQKSSAIAWSTSCQYPSTSLLLVTHLFMTIEGATSDVASPPCEQKHSIPHIKWASKKFSHP